MCARMTREGVSREGGSDVRAFRMMCRCLHRSTVSSDACTFGGGGNILCDGGPIARDGACIYDERDSLRARQVLLELVTNARVSRDVDDAYCSVT